MYRRFQLSICHSKRDIDVQKIKVENAFFVFSALSHVFPSIYFYDIYTTVCDKKLSIQKHIIQIDSTNS